MSMEMLGGNEDGKFKQLEVHAEALGEFVKPGVLWKSMCHTLLLPIDPADLVAHHGELGVCLGFGRLVLPQ